MALSPDGRRLAYAARRGGRTQLFVRDLGAREPRLVAGSEGAQHPFFSSDGQSVAFFADGLLKRVSVEGGTPVVVCEAPVVGQGAMWGPDDTIVFNPGSRRGLMRVAATGGNPEPVTSLDPAMDARNLIWPRFLPDGRGLLVTTAGGGEVSRVALLLWETREWRLFGPGARPQYLASGHLVYYTPGLAGGEIHAVRFDLERLETDGAPVAIVDGIYRAPGGGSPYFEVGDNGTLVYTPAGLDHALVRVDRDGRRTPLSDDRRGFRFPRVSPNGDRVAVTIDPRPSEIWVYDLERGSRIPIATDLHNIAPMWTLDGQRVSYRRGTDIYWRPADASSPAEPLIDLAEAVGGPNSWTLDGRALLFGKPEPSTQNDIWLFTLDGDARAVVATAADELGARLSPDGRWLAYFSEESGRDEVYVRPFPNVDAAKETVSTVGGWSPVWSPDGRELFYMDGARVMAVPVQGQGTTFVAGTPELLFEGPFDVSQDQNFDVSADGTYFVMVEVDPDTRPNRFQVVTNWFEELRRRVPVN